MAGTAPNNINVTKSSHCKTITHSSTTWDDMTARRQSKDLTWPKQNTGHSQGHYFSKQKGVFDKAEVCVMRWHTKSGAQIVIKSGRGQNIPSPKFTDILFLPQGIRLAVKMPDHKRKNVPAPGQRRCCFVKIFKLSQKLSPDADAWTDIYMGTTRYSPYNALCANLRSRYSFAKNPSTKP